MDKQEAFDFLRAHQPLPPERELSEAVITEYDRVREFFVDNPDEESIPLLLNSFGEGMGLGVYQLVGEVFRKHSVGVLVPYLLTALASKHRSVRWWSAQFAADFPHPDLIKPLATALEELGDFDIRCAAVTALSQIKTTSAKAVLADALDKEPEEEIRALIRDVLGDW